MRVAWGGVLESIVTGLCSGRASICPLRWLYSCVGPATSTFCSLPSPSVPVDVFAMGTYSPLLCCHVLHLPGWSIVGRTSICETWAARTLECRFCRFFISSRMGPHCQLNSVVASRCIAILLGSSSFPGAVQIMNGHKKRTVDQQLRAQKWNCCLAAPFVWGLQ